MPSKPRAAHDHYPTRDTRAITALLSQEAQRFSGTTIWEPSVGAGHLAEPMIAAGHTVIGSDLVDYGWPGTVVLDWYDVRVAPCPVIICNPPYIDMNTRGGGRWLRHLQQMQGWRYASFLLSWDWCAGRRNGLEELIEEFPFNYVYCLRFKVDFTGAGRPMHRSGWFTWDRDSDADRQIRFLNPPPKHHG